MAALMFQSYRSSRDRRDDLPEEAGGGEGEPHPDIVFASDWGTDTGNGEPAITDGGKWNGAGPIGNSVGTTRVSIVASTGLDFPTTNVVQGRYRNTTDTVIWVIEHFNGWTIPAVGGRMGKRFYFRHALIGSHVNELTTFHPVEPASGDCADEGEWQMNSGDSATYGTDADTSFLMRFKTKSHQWATVLPKFATYRVEELWTREATDTWKTELRIYDSSDVLIREDSDFTCDQHSNHVLSTQGVNEKTTTVSATCLQSQNLNWQGSAEDGRGSDDENNNRIYYSGYMVCVGDGSMDWPGPYVEGEAA